MKRITTILAATAFILFSCNDQKADETKTETTSSDTKTEPASTETKTTETAATNQPMDSAAMMKAMQDFAAVGPMHKWMAKSSGTWQAEITSYMNPAKPDKSKATNTTKTIMNGLYQVGDYSGNMFGAAFQGHSIMGYDNAKKMFVSTWIDNMGSGIIYMTGTYDEGTKTLNLKGKQTDPMTGKDADIREAMVFTDDNNYTLEMYGAGPDGKEMKWMEGTFKRKK